MTLGEVKAYQRKQINATKGKIPGTKWGSGAVGKYQIVGSTLKSLQKRLKLPDSAVYDVELQDKMGYELLKDAGYEKYQAGEISKHKFQKNLAKIWASIADPDTGKSAHNQPTGTTLEELEAALLD